jgi:hypothetical protein
MNEQKSLLLNNVYVNAPYLARKSINRTVKPLKIYKKKEKNVWVRQSLSLFDHSANISAREGISKNDSQDYKNSHKV